VDTVASAVLLLGVFALVAAIFTKTRRRNRGIGRLGPGAVGSVYDMLNQDKRNAMELILEERAEERTLEHEDDLVDPDGKPPASRTNR
jgi:hypothetical protein